MKIKFQAWEFGRKNGFITMTFPQRENDSSDELFC